MQTKSATWRRIISSFKLLLRFFQKSFFDSQKIRNLDFLYNFFQNPKFAKFSKNRTICCRPVPGHIACWISGWYVYFWQTYSPKPFPLMTPFFQTVSWSISRHRTEIKMPFLESWVQTGSETHLFGSKIPIWKFDLMWPDGWPDPSLSLTFWGQIAKWLLFLNSTGKSA